MSYSDLILNLQRLLIGIFGVSLLSLVGILFLTDPYQYGWYLWVFLANVFVLLSTLFALVGFYITFNRRNVDLRNLKLISIIKQSLVASSFIVIVIFLQTVQQLSLFNFLVLCLGYIMYEVWSH